MALLNPGVSEAIRSSETPALTRATMRNISEDGTVHCLYLLGDPSFGRDY
jgi:hypothetical protein